MSGTYGVVTHYIHNVTFSVHAGKYGNASGCEPILNRSREETEARCLALLRMHGCTDESTYDIQEARSLEDIYLEETYP